MSYDLTAAAVAEQLGLDADQLAAYVAAGAPHRGRGKSLRFDEAELAAWLVAHGHADRGSRIVATVIEVARHFGRSERSVHYWKTEGMPGEAGAYDLEAIERWLRDNAKRIGGDEGTGDTLTEWKIRTERARALDAELELRRKRGEVIDAGGPLRLMTRHIAETRALLDQLAPRIVARFGPRPAKDWGRFKQQVQRWIEEAVDDACLTLADALESDAVGLDAADTPEDEDDDAAA